MNSSQNFCIWHTGRCGSTVLSSMLNQHPQIYCAEEVLEMYSKAFERLRYKLGAWSGSKLFIRYAMLNNCAETFGFEMKVWHLFRLGVSVSKAMHFIHNMGINKHIVLERNNYLRVIVSSTVARQTSSWHIKSKHISPFMQVYVDANGLAYAIQKFSDFYNEIKVLLGQHGCGTSSLDGSVSTRRNYLGLSYEKDILQNPKIAFNKAVNFLDLDELEPSISLGLTNPYPLKETILNFDEISDRLRNTPYEWMLEI